MIIWVLFDPSILLINRSQYTTEQFFFFLWKVKILVEGIHSSGYSAYYPWYGGLFHLASSVIKCLGLQYLCSFGSFLPLTFFLMEIITYSHLQTYYTRHSKRWLGSLHLWPSNAVSIYLLASSVFLATGSLSSKASPALGTKIYQHFGYSSYPPHLFSLKSNVGDFMVVGILSVLDSESDLLQTLELWYC